MGANDFEGSDGGPLPYERCPHCRGNGGGEAFINRGPDISTHTVEWVTCLTCNGVGTVGKLRASLIAKGKAMRDARVAQKETLLEASRRLGIGPAELNAIEMGRAPTLAYEPEEEPERHSGGHQ